MSSVPACSAKRAPADRKAKAFFRKADPVMARLIDAHLDFRPRASPDELPPPDAFGTLVCQVLGQQLSVAQRMARDARTLVNVASPPGGELRGKSPLDSPPAG
jgi:3-methyladenine DNA glycosylase/8-oxoguanine DNA glycosylase